MSYREAASQAGQLVHSDDVQISRLGVELLRNLAKKQCFLAIATLYYLTERTNTFELDTKLVETQFDSAIAKAETFSDPLDVYDAAHFLRFRQPDRALMLFKVAAEMGLGIAAYEVCDINRHILHGSKEWLRDLRNAASLGASEAMVELGLALHVLDKVESETWLRSAAYLGNLRAREILGLSQD